MSEATDKLPEVLVAASSGFVNVVCIVGSGFSDFFLHPDNPKNTVMLTNRRKSPLTSFLLIIFFHPPFYFLKFS